MKSNVLDPDLMDNYSEDNFSLSISCPVLVGPVGSQFSAFWLLFNSSIMFSIRPHFNKASFHSDYVLIKGQKKLQDLT